MINVRYKLKESGRQVISRVMSREGLQQKDVAEGISMKQSTLSAKLTGTNRFSGEELESLYQCLNESQDLLFLHEPESNQDYFGIDFKKSRREDTALQVYFELLSESYHNAQKTMRTRSFLVDLSGLVKKIHETYGE